MAVMRSSPLRARIDEDKVRAYLLSPTHPVGRSKARVFAALGFDEGTADRFIAELRRIPAEGAVSGGDNAAEFGEKYFVPGELEGPTGTAQVVTIWLRERGQGHVRLITVCPNTP